MLPKLRRNRADLKNPFLLQQELLKSAKRRRFLVTPLLGQSENPFYVQQRAIKTVAKIKKAIRGRKNITKTNIPSNDLVQMAHRMDKPRATNQDFVDFINEVKVAIRNRLGAPGTDMSPDYEAQVAKIRTQLLPVWDAQFKRLFNRAVEEDKISIERLKFFQSKYLDETKHLHDANQTYEDAETATHTGTIPVTSLDIVQRSNRMRKQQGQGQGVEVDPSLVRRLIGKDYRQLHNPAAQQQKVYDIEQGNPLSGKIQEYLDVLERQLETYKKLNSRDNYKRVLKIFDGLRELQDADARQEQVDSATEQNLLQAAQNEINSFVQYNKNIAGINGTAMALRSEIDVLADHLTNLGTQYNAIIMVKPGYVTDSRQVQIRENADRFNELKRAVKAATLSVAHANDAIQESDIEGAARSVAEAHDIYNTALEQTGQFEKDLEHQVLSLHEEIEPEPKQEPEYSARRQKRLKEAEAMMSRALRKRTEELEARRNQELQDETRRAAELREQERINREMAFAEEEEAQEDIQRGQGKRMRFKKGGRTQIPRKFHTIRF